MEHSRLSRKRWKGLSLLSAMSGATYTSLEFALRVRGRQFHPKTDKHRSPDPMARLWRDGVILRSKRAVRLDPKNARAHYQLAVAYQRLQCYRPALVEAEQASIIRPKEPLYRIGVSNALSQLGRHDEAIDVLKEGIKDKPKYADFSVH